MSEGNEVSAKDVVEAIFKEDKPEYVLEWKTIKGMFDLRLRVISVTVKITNCTFEDEVDLSYCEFRQCVDFSGSRFKGEFCSSNAIYQKDIKCEKAIFDNGVRFDDVQCQGNGYFAETIFENPNRIVEFSGSKFNLLSFSGGYLQIIETKFMDDLNNSKISEDLRIELGNGNIPLSHNIQISVEVKDAIWLIIDNDKKQTYTVICHINGLLIFMHRGAIFRGGARFSDIQCERYGIFENAHFENEDKDINFDLAKFGVDLDCTGAVFKGKSSFNSIQCGRAGIFRNAHFENEDKDINFARAKFGSDLDCSKAVFKGRSSFNGIQCEGTGFFKNAKFENVKECIYFSYARFDVNLEFSDAIFAGEVNFFHAQISRVLMLINTTFQKNVSLNCASSHTFCLEDSREKENYGTFKDYINLQRLEFTVFEGTKEQQKHIVDKQSPDKFSMDPYLQFEKYYRSIGDDSHADDVYYDGRKKLRENAKHKINPDINWSKKKLKFDWLNWLLLGYGIKLWHTFVALAVFLLLGMLLFLSDESMTPKAINVNNSGFMIAIDGKFRDDFVKGISKEFRKQFEDNKLPLYEKAFTGIVKDEKEWWIINYPSYDILYKAKMKGNDIKIYRTTYLDWKHFYKYYSFYKRFFHRLGYSLDMLLPVVDLKIADEYRFPSGGRGVYMVIHILAGWILIPLLISSLAGILRKKG